jgi:hypothetical protein
VTARAFLETWPERAPVAFTTDRPAAGYRVVRVVPSAPLDDRWYVNGLTSLPSLITYDAQLPDGTIGSRFRPGSHPRVSHIQFCEKAGGGMKLLVNFSEPVTLSRTAEEIVTLKVGGVASPCTSYGAGPDALYFTCDALSPTAAVVVTVASDGAAGVSSVSLEGGSWPVNIGSLTADSCRIFATPL